MKNMNELIKKIWYLMIIVASFLSCGMVFGSEVSVDNPAFNVTATMSKDDPTRIEFTLQNMSEQSLSFYHGALSRSSIVLIVAKSSPYGGTLDEDSYIDDPLPGSFQVKPHGKYMDSINLTEIYPNFETELKKRDLIVFWSVSLSTIENKADRQRFGGYVLIKKKKQQVRLN